MSCTTFACGDSLQTVWESLLTKGVFPKYVSKCSTILCVIFIKHDNHCEMLDLLYSCGLQVMEVQVTMSKALIHGCGTTEIQAPVCTIQMDENNIQHSVQNPGLVEFPLYVTLKDIGGKVVLPQILN